MVRKLTFLPTIAAISPTTAAPGATVSGIITGKGLAGITAVTFTGNGITATVGSGGSPSSLPVTISIGPNAFPGPQPFTVFRSDGTSAIFNGFTVSKKRGGQVTSQ
jgi:hypothetical protein